MMLYKIIRKAFMVMESAFYTPIGRVQLFLNGAHIQKGLKVRGIMKIFVTRRGKVLIGENFRVNSGNRYNIIGRQQKTTLWVDGKLEIGNNVGMSSTAIICNHSITIGNNVIFGGNTVIYDTDFHPIDPNKRLEGKDRENATKKPVKIGDHVFIGAHSTILKGVTIGDNAVIGACSVVTKNIPANEIWAGNPAQHIKILR
jgi:acetyltransferase-like isoleucine patch superfamily enzyme